LLSSLYLPSERSRVQNKITEVKVLEVLTEGLGEERAEEGFADELLAWAEGGRESEEVFVVSGEPVGDVVGVAISWTWDLKQW
jgi:hypothetical protein